MTAYAPYQGFGDPNVPDRFCPFRVRAVNGTYPEWEQEMLQGTRQFAGASSSVTQIGGFGPARLTLPLWFDNHVAFARFRAHYGTVATLSLLARLSNHEGIIRTINGIEYEQYRDTLLVNISNVISSVDGTVECHATFQRAYDPRAVTP